MIERLTSIPSPPPDGADLPCQWDQLTTTGPALDWPQDQWRLSVHQIGIDCDRTADELVTFACPLIFDDETGQHVRQCDTGRHEVFTVCGHHMTYSRPSWTGVQRESHGHLHGLARDLLATLALYSDEWREWWSIQQARHRTARDAEDGDAEVVVYEPTLF